MHDAVSGDPLVRFTIGRVVVEPNAPSVVPARVTFRIDLRHPENGVLDRFGQELQAIAQTLAAPCSVSIRCMVDASSCTFDPGLQQAIASAAARHGYRSLPVLSAAGHDARQMAPLARSAMIFIPCRGGVSHHPDEWAEPAHVAAGAAVLLDLLLQEAGLPFEQGNVQ